MDASLITALREAWRANHRITRMLLDATSDAGLAATLSSRGGRDVARQFAHIHDNRRAQLEGRAKDLAEGIPKFAVKGQKVTPDRAGLEAALELSAERIETFLVDLVEGNGAEGKPKRRGFRRGIFTTLSYLVAHEAHHRGSIALTLKQCGEAIPADVRAGLWAWDQV